MLRRLLNNFRRGFATNSSSSHSLVYFKDEVADSNPIPITDVEFGWGDFTLASLGNKLMYALVARLQRDGHSTGYWETPSNSQVDGAYERYKHLFPEFGPDEFRTALGGYIDHQSADGDPDLTLEQARDPHVVFYGGNDNDGYDVYAALSDAGDTAEYGSFPGSDYKITPEEAKENDYRW